MDSWRHLEVVTTNLLGEPTVEGIVLTLRDVTERKRLEDELKHQAFHDALSGLANRPLFRDRLEHALARAARSLTSLAVLFLDLDDFKLVNDTLGPRRGRRAAGGRGRAPAWVRCARATRRPASAATSSPSSSRRPRTPRTLVWPLSGSWRT